MPVNIKRSFSATPEEVDIVTPPTSDADDLQTPPKKTKMTQKSPKSPSKSSKSKDGEVGDKRTRTPWSAEEEAIFCDLAGEVLKDYLWNKVKEDGRLVSRGSCGIKVHAAAAISKMKKAPQV